MTDHPPFVPPGGSAPRSSPPPPTGLPSPGPAPTAPRRSRRGLWIALAVIGGLVALGLLIGAAVLTANILGGLVDDSGPISEEQPGQGDDSPPAEEDPDAEDPDAEEPDTEEPVAGDGQNPLAVEPLVCDGCFELLQLGNTVPDDAAFEALGLTNELDAWGDYPTYDTRLELDFQFAAWARDGGSPVECFFTYPTSPVGPDPDAPVGGGDVVEYTGSRSDARGTSTVSQSARLFLDSAAAVDYMVLLREAVLGCDTYELGSGWEPDVEPGPAFDLPDDVAGIGWVETSFGDRLLVADLQRGNLVVRTTVWTTRGGPSEADFRVFVEGLAAQISEIPPRG